MLAIAVLHSSHPYLHHGQSEWRRRIWKQDATASCSSSYCCASSLAAASCCCIRGTFDKLGSWWIISPATTKLKMSSTEELLRSLTVSLSCICNADRLVLDLGRNNQWLACILWIKLERAKWRCQQIPRTEHGCCSNSVRACPFNPHWWRSQSVAPHQRNPVQRWHWSRSRVMSTCLSCCKTMLQKNGSKAAFFPPR